MSADIGQNVLDSQLDPNNDFISIKSKLLSCDIEKDFNLLASVENEEEISLDEGIEAPLPDILYINFCFEQSGIGLCSEESFRIYIALKQLVDTYPIKSLRFWGKIFGTHQNYYIAETEFAEGDIEDEAESSGEPDESEVEKNADEEEGNEAELLG
ncbi:unnamed protein product [Protopolystoma xenopodis]|uniref:Uncharacterized protein n=1 Tax=Protopolystoma xenopodis TaxID=117903 RepID=A0A3S5A7G6_9PLAT|nr:unnamed protein product [Protopolystoma xenopodis]